MKSEEYSFLSFRAESREGGVEKSQVPILRRRVYENISENQIKMRLILIINKSNLEATKMS